MTLLPDLIQLRALSQVLYDQQKKELQALLRKEAALRTELAHLSKMSDVHRAPDTEMRALGADVLWQGWLGRAKTNLNIELAKVLAQKSHEQKKVRHAFGKVTALESLIGTAQEDQEKSRAQIRLNAAISQALHGPNA